MKNGQKMDAVDGVYAELRRWNTQYGWGVSEEQFFKGEIELRKILLPPPPPPQHLIFLADLWEKFKAVISRLRQR